MKSTRKPWTRKEIGWALVLGIPTVIGVGYVLVIGCIGLLVHHASLRHGKHA